MDRKKYEKGLFGKKTFDVILTECPSLRYLGYSGYGEEMLDVSNNPLLDVIDFHEIRNEKLDLSANPLLEELHIRGAKDLKSLNLSKNDKLRRLDIFMCQNLQRLALSNQSQLNEVDFALTALRPKDLDIFERPWKEMLHTRYMEEVLVIKSLLNYETKRAQQIW